MTDPVEIARGQEAEGPVRSTVTLALWALIWCLDERDGDPDLELEEDRCGGFDDTPEVLVGPIEWRRHISNIHHLNDDFEYSDQPAEMTAEEGDARDGE
jgi:hypothetical protein